MPLVYTGTLLWGLNARDGSPPVRVEDAFPAIVSKDLFSRVQSLMRSRAPRRAHPRRVGSSYLLSGLVRCKSCRRALSGQDSKSGKFSCYVCQSLLKRGRDACEAPRLNARRFESLVVDQIRANILTESNIRDLVRLVGEELDGVAREQRQQLETIESELADVRRRLDRLYHLMETTDLDISDVLPRVREHKERRERLEQAATEARTGLSDRRAVLDDVETITAYAQDMREFLATSELTESKAFIRSFVKEIAVAPGAATIRYTIPMPGDSPLQGGVAEQVALDGPVLSTVKSGGPDWTKSRTAARSLVTPPAGIGMVYVSSASSPETSMACTKLRISALRSGNVPSSRNSRKSATYALISSEVGSSTRRSSSCRAASSRAAANWSSRWRSSRIRGESACIVSSVVSRAS